MLNRFLKVAMLFFVIIFFICDFCFAASSLKKEESDDIGLNSKLHAHEHAKRKDSGSSTDSLSHDSSNDRPSFESEQAATDAHRDVSYINPLVSRGNLGTLLARVPYNTCPEFAYNHPSIQGALIFDAESGATPFIKARAFYLLHVVYDNMQLRTSKDMEDTELEKLSQNALDRSKSLLSGISEDAFNGYVKEWERDFIYNIKSTDDDERLKLLARIENTYFDDKKEKWRQYKETYERLSKKYIHESIELAKAALRDDLPVKTAPKEFLRHANTQYYAEGCIKMAEYLRTLAVGDVAKKEYYFNLAKDLYKKALLEFDDIRGYEYLSAMGEVMEEDVVRKWRELRPMYAGLKERLLTLFPRDPS